MKTKRFGEQQATAVSAKPPYLAWVGTARCAVRKLTGKESAQICVYLRLTFLAWLLAGTAWAGVLGTDYNNIEYLCCDWGSAMTLPSKTNEAAQFNDTEDEVYFLKQVTSFTRKKRLMKDVFSGRDYEDVGKGLSIWLCKMKADGSGKTEIKELWKNPAYPIDTQIQSTWMDVNEKTRTIAFSITYAGSDITGLWTVQQDGSELKRIITPTMIEGGKQSIDSPSWTPDGRWIVFGESLRGATRVRIVKCDREGKQFVCLTENPGDSQPRVSPDGKTIVYIHNPLKLLERDGRGERWVAATLWLMNLDGSNKREIPNPEAKFNWPAKGISGSYPAWSPDGQRIYAVGVGVIDVTTGKKILNKSPRSITSDGKVLEQYSNVVMPHWGKLGLLCGGWGGGITFVDKQFNSQHILANSEESRVR